MKSATLGIVLDSSILIAAERRKRTATQIIEDVLNKIGVLPIIPFRFNDCRSRPRHLPRRHTGRRERRRRFLNDLQATIPVEPITETTAEIIARIGAEQAVKGINLPLADLIIGACALELGYSIVTDNKRDFERIPGLNIISL